MNSLKVDISISRKERKNFLANMNSVGSHVKHLRKWMWLHSFMMALLFLFPQICLAMLILSFDSTALQAALIVLERIGQHIGSFALIVISTTVWAALIVGTCYTPRSLAAISSGRQIWAGLNRIELSPSGVTAGKTFSEKIFLWKKIKNIYLLDEAIYFLMGTQQINVFFIPLSAFKSQEQIDEALDLIRDYWQGEIRTGQSASKRMFL
ncbi:MAG: hypothetical protein FWD93_03250 [Coriobacteriia bacterium]|nr:hypothetical protein [Coriobacteriia bacterium]